VQISGNSEQLIWLTLRRNRHLHWIPLSQARRGGSQYATTPLCGGPFGPDSTYCDTVLTPTP
jgi:hypothetical protein